MMKSSIGITLLMVIAFFLIGCTPVEKECSVDKDCVPATCCHAGEAVGKEQGPDCRGQLCTQECVAGTIDCNQGSIKCVSGECKVVLI